MEDINSSDESYDSEVSIEDMGRKQSKSMVKQYRTASNHFVKFLTHKKSRFEMQSLPNEYLTEALIGEFATYMIDILKIRALQTLMTYISDIKNKLQDTYPQAIAFTDPREKWYTKVRSNLAKHWLRVSEEDGLVFDDTAPVEERHVEFISQVLIEEKIEGRTCIHDRLLLIWDRHLIGRIMEVSNLRWCKVLWDVKHAAVQVMILCYIML